MSRVQLNLLQVIQTSQQMAFPLVRRTVSQIETGAKRLTPRGDHRHGSGKPRRTQALQPSIRSRVTVGRDAVNGTVGSNAAHAATVHQGSKPHVIRAKGKVLKFTSDRLDYAAAARRGRRGGNKRQGGFHFRMRVMHPGNKRPVRFLTTPLIQFGQANGFSVTLFVVPGGEGSRLP